MGQDGVRLGLFVFELVWGGLLQVPRIRKSSRITRIRAHGPRWRVLKLRSGDLSRLARRASEGQSMSQLVKCSDLPTPPRAGPFPRRTERIGLARTLALAGALARRASLGRDRPGNAQLQNTRAASARGSPAAQRRKIKSVPRPRMQAAPESAQRQKDQV